ncbi:hypothetical protein M422DRAFT_783568 [Sphaerobolus stellatus SS14]|uniref:Uncharacterized protein n=1 Tax=Sphaerobolus stellatus (strain SS14) TaxID=990650 RepID=A0A0C9V3R7_SPHS4|nr:hypothetical protein M422DRAFT_783568 [Sphaerobolus stellatus SS14]
MSSEDTEHIICVDFTAAVQFAYNVEDYTLEQHPRLTALALYIWSCYPEAPIRLLRTIIWDFPKAILQGFLGCLGFKNEGIERESFAAHYQSRTFNDGYIPQDSMFAYAQSYGAIGTERRVQDGRIERTKLMVALSWILRIGAVFLFSSTF